jgi:hypothetical protein
LEYEKLTDCLKANDADLFSRIKYWGNCYISGRTTISPFKISLDKQVCTPQSKLTSISKKPSDEGELTKISSMSVSAVNGMTSFFTFANPLFSGRTRVALKALEIGREKIGNW